MKIGQQFPLWLCEDLRVPRLLLGAMLLCAIVGLFSLRSDDKPFSNIGIGATIFWATTLAGFVTILVIRQREVFVRDFLLCALVYFSVACLWKWRALSQVHATVLWMSLLWVCFALRGIFRPFL